MIIRVIKQLNPEDAKLIREKSKKLNDLKEIFNLSHYIYNDFQNREDIKIEKNDWFRPPTIKKEMGSLTLSKFIPELSYFGTFFYQKRSEKKYRYVPDMSLNVYIGIPDESIKFGKANLDFIMGNNPTQGSGPHTFRIGPLEDTSRTIIQDIVNFFYDKKKLYKKFLEMLSENKTLLIKNMGLDCYQDFISLFSANYNLKTIPNINVPKENIKKILIIHRKSYEDIKKGQEHIGTFYKTSNSSTDCSSGIEGISLLLDKANQLTIDISLDDVFLMLMRYKSLTSENLDEFKNEKEFQKMIDDNISIWLKTIIRMSDFASAIFEKIKSKIIVENI